MDSLPRHLIITVHGIRTFGHWQERLEELVQERNPLARLQHYKYGYFSCVAFMVPFLRWWVTRRFRRALGAACRGSAWDRVDLVAHSFGTHLAAWGLHGIPRGERPKIHTLILAGSVLKPSFPWRELTDESVGGCVGRVVNDCGTKDGVLVLNQAVVLFTGMAGRVGFAGMSHDRFRNRFFAHGHSGYFLREGRSSDEFMRTWWVPVLCGDEPVAVPEDPRGSSPLEGLVAFALNNAEPVKIALAVAPFAFIAVLFFGLYRQAEAQREQARRRLVEMQVANAERHSDEGDLATSLLWYAEALRSGDTREERDQRVRLATALRQHPKLMWILFPDGLGDSGDSGWRPRRAAFNPDATLVAMTGWSMGEGGARVWDVETGEATTTLLAHSNEVNSIAFSSDGERIVTASSDHTARVWNARTGAPLTPPLQHDAQLVLAQFSPDGERVLTVGRAGGDGRSHARVWDLRSAQAVGAAMPHGRTIGDAAFSPDGARVATISSEGTTRIWDATSGDPTCPALSSGDDRGSLCVAFSADGGRLVTCNGEQIQVWNDRGGSVGGPWLQETCAHVEFVDTDTVIGVTADGATQLWSVRQNAPIAGPYPHGAVQAAWISTSAPLERAGQALALAWRDGTARVWDAHTESPLSPPLRHSGAVAFARLSSNGRRLVTIDVEGLARVWDLSPSPALVLDHATPFEAPNLWSASFSPDGSRVLTTTRDLNSAHVRDASTGVELFELLHSGALECARFSADGKRVVTSSADRTARVWDARTGEPIGAPMQHSDAVQVASFSPEGRRVVTGCADGTARIWSASDGEALSAPIEYGPPIVDALFSPDGLAVLVAGGASAKLYDAQTLERLTGGPRQNEIGLAAAALSPDGLRIATGGLDGVARVWDARSGEPVTPPLVHSSGPKYMNMSQRVNHVEFSPDSRLLASSSSDTTTRIWDAATGVPAGPALVGADQHAAFHPGVEWIATAGSSGVARVWNARTGKAVTPPLVHGSVVTCVEFDASGLRLVSASLDGTVRIWNLAADERPAEELQRLAEVLACRRIDETGGILSLTPQELKARWSSLREATIGPLAPR